LLNRPPKCRRLKLPPRNIFPPHPILLSAPEKRNPKPNTPVRAVRAESTALHGMKAICEYTGKSENTVIKYIRDEGFPASKIGGAWESDAAAIDAWRQKRILGEDKNNIL
jgi:predicted DNA-binding transcriptional regulator AlpA